MTTAPSPKQAILTIENVKTSMLFIIISLFLANDPRCEDAQIQLKEIEEKDFSTLSIDDGRVLAQRAGDTGIGTTANAFVKAAIKSERAEIIALCWENNYLSSIFHPVYAKIPDSHLKHQLFSKYLRSSRIHWPEQTTMRFFNGMEEDGLRDFFIPVLQKYIPALPMNYGVIDSREKRLMLADAFDKAVGIPIVVEPEARRIGLPPRPNKHEATLIVPAVSPSAGDSTVATVPSREVLSFRDRGFVWLSAFAAVLAAGATWIYLRFRRKQ